MPAQMKTANGKAQTSQGEAEEEGAGGVREAQPAVQVCLRTKAHANAHPLLGCGKICQLRLERHGSHGVCVIFVYDLPCQLESNLHICTRAKMH